MLNSIGEKVVFNCREMVFRKEAYSFPFVYNNYTNDLPQDQQTSGFIYADDLCITCEDDWFDQVEET